MKNRTLKNKNKIVLFFYIEKNLINFVLYSQSLTLNLLGHFLNNKKLLFYPYRIRFREILNLNRLILILLSCFIK